ncbi:MAG: 50S ribosomal protein L24e [Candidatus Anstonellaceae archaeon]
MAFCSFCNNEILAGSGEMYVLRDGAVLSFCSSKCKKNHLKLRREGRLVKWTSKILVLSSEKKEEKKQESALAKEIEQKLKEKEAAKKEGKR